MAESIVQVTEGVGKKLHTNSYTVGANTVEDEVMLVGPQPWACYNLFAENISSATAAAHVAQIMAGASLKVRIVRISVTETAAPAGALRIEIVRLATAGTGGGAITAAGIGLQREWKASSFGKALVIPAGTTNGIALKTSGLAASTVDWEIEFVETPF